MNNQMTRFAVGRWCRTGNATEASEAISDGFSNEARAAVPIPAADRPKKYRRVCCCRKSETGFIGLRSLSRRSLNRRDQSVVEITQGEKARSAFAGACCFPGDRTSATRRLLRNNSVRFGGKIRGGLNNGARTERAKTGCTTNAEAACDATVGEFSSAGDLGCWHILSLC